MPTVRVPGFLPSTSGFHFPNAFPRAPAIVLGPVKLGNAANGLCGGMAFAAMDLRAAGRTPPPDTEPPPPGSPWFRYLVSRLLRSWGLPWGGIRYVWWTLLPDRDLGPLRGVARRTRGQCSAILRQLEAGDLVALGVIRVRTWNLLRVGLNHQMVAYGYEGSPAGGAARILVYDPNHPDDDELAITLPLTGVPGLEPTAYLPGEMPVRGFFATRYRRRTPPG